MHAFAEKPKHPAHRGASPTTETARPARAPRSERVPPRIMRMPAPHARGACACGGGCPRCRGERQALRDPLSRGPSPGPRARHLVEARGPRFDGLEDAPYRGADGAAPSATRGPGTGHGMGCVIGPMRLVNSGALEGGYSVNDYLTGGLSWGAVGSPTSGGADGRGFKVQLAADFAGDTSLGVSQTMTHGGSNQAFLDGTAAYLGRAAGTVANGVTFNEPVLNAADPYAHTGWELQYGPKTGTTQPSLLSFADVPRAGPGEKGYIDFRTCFHSRGGPCQEATACRTWRWTIDFTGTNTTNTVA
jgi:hypothetical protein